METLILGVTVLTSAIAYVVAVRWLRLSRRGLAAAGRAMARCVGWTVIFGAANLAVAGGIILALRFSNERFLSLYLLDDASWLVLPLLQGITWSLWREGSL